MIHIQWSNIKKEKEKSTGKKVNKQKGDNFIDGLMSNNVYYIYS